MLITQLFENPTFFLEFIAAILIGLTIHEAAHAYCAYLLGDPTAKIEGRVSLNPFVHLDPWGVLFLLWVGFGWGKPVPVNSSLLRGGIKGEILTSLAGIITNLILAALLAMVVRFIPMPSLLMQFLIVVIALNLLLAAFNILPIPPLDGAILLKPILGEENFLKYESIGLPLLFILLFSSYLGFPILQTIIYGMVNFFFTLFLGNGFTLF